MSHNKKEQILINFRFFILFIISFFWFLYPPASAEPSSIRLFIKTFEAETGISPKFAEKFRDKLVLHFFGEGKGKYRVISEDDIKIMYEQAEQLLATGCDAEECLMQVAYAIDADIIIYGNLEKTDEGKIYCLAQSLVRDRETDTLTKSSIVEITFFESQLDWFAKEIVKKLIDPSYYIDTSKAPMKLKVQILPEALETPELTTAELKVLKFKTDDSALKMLVQVLRNIVTEGDYYFKNNNIELARKKYREVINKIETKITEEKQAKLSQFKDDVLDRIADTYKIELQEILKQGDRYFREKNYKEAFKTYASIKSTINNIPDGYIRTKLYKLEEIVKKRMDLITVAKAKEEVLKADAFYSDYKFDEAIDSYDTALVYLNNLQIKDNIEHNQFLEEVENKREVAFETGCSYFLNKIKSYRDKIEVFNIRDKLKRAENTFYEMRNYIKNSKFYNETTRYEARRILSETAEVLGLSLDEIERAEREAEERKRVERDFYGRRWILDIEFGSGHQGNLFFAVNFNRIGFGLGGAVTFGNIEILGFKYNEILYNFVFLMNIRLIQYYDKFWVSLRGKYGKEWIRIWDKDYEDENEWTRIGDWKADGIFYAIDLLIGSKKLYGTVSVPVFVGKEGTGASVQIGLGVRFRF